MKKRIFSSLIIISLLAIIISSVVTAYFSNKIYEKNLEKELYYIISLIDYNMTNSENIDETLKTISNIDKDVRISYFSSNGTPLFDSVVDVSKMKNHKDRKEIKGAILYGKYSSRRHSDTLSKDTYYIAIKLKNQNVLRASMQVDTIFKTAVKIMPVVILVFALIIAMSLLLSSYATKKILKPLDSYTGDIKSIDLDKIPEISPFVSKITSQKNTIKKQILAINKEKETINTMLENMKEGMIILDEQNNILSMNKKAIEFLNSPKDILGKNILYATRNSSIIQALNNCYAGEYSSGYFGEDVIIKYYVNPVYEENKISGAILLLINETKRKKLETIREEFSANVSHELKTPLTSIYGFCELLKNDMLKSDEQKTEVIETMYKESKRLIDMIDEIILISKLEVGSSMNKENIDIGKIMQDIKENIKSKLEEKNISLSCNGTATIYANSLMMWNLLYNLVENAIKYNKENGEIIVNIEEDENIKISVKDTGIGIESTDVSRIFERFYRADKSRNKKTGGSGLGLSIVKHIAQSHGGDVSVESISDVGSTFTVILPKK